MVLDSFPPKSHTRKKRKGYDSGVYYGRNNANFQDTSDFSSVKSASGPNKYGVFQEEIPWLADAVRFYTDIQPLCANNCSGVCGICMLRYKIDLKVQQLLKLCEFNTPRANEEVAENDGYRCFRNFNNTKQNRLNRRFSPNGEKKNSRNVARARSGDSDNLKVSKSVPDHVSP